jgi:hypothetical protein
VAIAITLVPAQRRALPLSFIPGAPITVVAEMAVAVVPIADSQASNSAKPRAPANIARLLGLLSNEQTQQG